MWIFPEKWPVSDTAYKYTNLGMWSTLIITIDNLQGQFSETKWFKSLHFVQE